MTEPYVGEIRIFAGNYAPYGWALCQGQSLPIYGNDVLFQLIGTTYGGDGETYFNLPNLCGRIPIHQGTSTTGTNYVLSETGGQEQVTLTTQQIPNHTHPPLASNRADGNSANPNGRIWASPPDGMPFTSPVSGASLQPMNPGLVGPVGGSQPHNNFMPFLKVNFIIALAGVFPSQT